MIELLCVERDERRPVLDERVRFSGIAGFVESDEVAFEDARDQHGSEPLALSVPLVGERGALERALAEDEERRANLWAGCETHVLNRDRERKPARPQSMYDGWLTQHVDDRFVGREAFVA